MITCDRYPTERATTMITLPSSKHLALCAHHTRKVSEQLTQRGQNFDIEYMK